MPAIDSPRRVRVVIVDAERIPDEISAAHPDGGRYAGVWILARVGGQPRGLFKERFKGDRMSRPEIEALFADPQLHEPVPDQTLPDRPPRVSVIVCSTFRRIEEMRNCVAALAALEYPNFEILVVDNRREDGESVDWVLEYPGVRLLRERRPGLSAARNCGLRAASGEIVAYTDDDVVVDPGWIAAYVRRLAAHPEEAAAGGMLLPSELETEAQLTFEDYFGDTEPRLLRPVSHRLTRRAGGNPLRPATLEQLAEDGRTLRTFSLYSPASMGGGANMAFRTEPLRAIGGFNLALGAGTLVRGGEDIEIFMRLAWRGHSVGFEPAALASHVHRRNMAELEQQVIDGGLGFTATLLALVVRDPRHLGAIVATLPRAAATMTRRFVRRQRSDPPGRGGPEQPGTIAWLARIETLAMLRGPAAWVKSVRRVRRWRP